MHAKFLLAGLVLAGMSMPVLAQTVVNPDIQFTASADMPGIANPNKNNTFNVAINDDQVHTNLSIVCQSGGTKFMFLHRDKECRITGNGAIINPANKQALQRTQYGGGFTVHSDGSTDASQIEVNYLALGKVPADKTLFGGSLNLRPEQTSSGAAALQQVVLNKLSLNNNGAQIDNRTDTIDVNGLNIPSAGFPSDKGTTWNGNMIFSYQSNSWYLDLKATYNGKDYNLKGNMPWTDSPNASNQTQYDLTLTVPSASNNNDDALFDSANANNDLFATVDGIAGTIIMKQSNMVTVKIEGKDTTTPARVDASGSFHGTNIPLDVVRSFAVMFGILSDNFFGA